MLMEFVTTTSIIVLTLPISQHISHMEQTFPLDLPIIFDTTEPHSEKPIIKNTHT